MVKTVSPIFMDLFRNVNDPVLILNTSCHIESVNNRAAQFLKLNFTEKQPLQMDEPSKTRWTRFIKKIQKQKYGNCILKVKVNHTYQDIKVMGYYYSKKKLIFARIDLAVQSNLDYEINQISPIFNYFSHGIILSDLNGNVVDINEIALNYIQCERSQVVNQPKEIIFERFLDYPFIKLKYCSDLISNRYSSIDLVRKDENGKEMYFKAESKYNFSLNLIITTITDETEKVTLKRKLEHQSSLYAIGQMTASIAHEIRNPMTSLKGFIDLLQINSTEVSRKYLKVMDSELQRMDTILTELLYLSKPKEHFFDQISLYRVVEEVIEIMQPHACLDNILLQMEFEEDDICRIMGNENRIKQLLINLIKNAIEEMQSGGTITIGLKHHHNQFIELFVRDQGKGIPEEEVNHLFTPFYTTKASGTGLGLALVKKVIEEHNGTLKVESLIGVGTTFNIQLPCIDGNHVFYNKNEELINLWGKSNLINRLPIV